MFWLKLRLLMLGCTLNGVAAALRLPLPPKMAVLGFIEKNGRYLVLDLSYRNGFGFPGGLLEGNETLEEGLVREIFEETGLTIVTATYITSKKERIWGFPVVTAAFAVTVSGTIHASSEGSLHYRTSEEILARTAYQNSRDAFIHYLALKK